MLQKPYAGNGKPFVYALFAPEDQTGAEMVLRAMQERGVEVWPSVHLEKRRMDKSALVLLFLSPAAVGNEGFNRAMQHAVQTDHPLLVVHVSPTALTSTQRLLLNTQQAILQYDCASDASFYDKLFGAQPMQNLTVTAAQKRAANLTTGSLIGGILLAVALAIYLALGSGATVPEDSVLAGLGYQGKMADITSIYLYGDHVENKREDDVVSGVIYDDKGKVFSDALFLNMMQVMAPFGEISDVSDFSQLRNLRELSIAGNPISDIQPLLALRNLEYLNLTGDPVQSISGIDALQNLKTLSIGWTKITDLTPLQNCHKLQSVYVDETQYRAFTQGSADYGFELIPIGSREELAYLSAHIFGGPEESGGDYAVFVKTKSWNVYESYSFAFYKNDRQIPITRREAISSFADGRIDKVHLFINQAAFGAYDPTAVYQLVIHDGDTNAIYRVFHKYDKTNINASMGELISTNGY